MMIKITILTTVLSMVLAVKHLLNVDCGAHVDYIATDPVYHQYTPYYVRLHRCHGANLGVNPQNKKCLPVADNITEIEVIGLSYANGAQFMSILKVQNHTKCKEECVLQSSSCTPYETFEPNDCACNCNYTSTPKNNTCKAPFYWHQETCNCRCKHTSLDCEAKKTFSAESCGCVCKDKFRIRCANRKKYLDESTCGCIDPSVINTGTIKSDCGGDIKGGILAVVMILEALAFLVAYFFVYSYWYKRKYLPRRQAKTNSLYHHNGDIANNHNRPPTEFNTISVEEEEYSAKPIHNDKDLIIKEEENALEKKDLLNRPVYYLDDEKSHLTSKQDDEWYMYNDIMEVDGPSNNDSNGSNRLQPPDYSDYVSSDLSEDGYASVTQV